MEKIHIREYFIDNNLGIGLGNEDEDVLLSFVSALKPHSNYVEIGVSDGYSLSLVASYRPDIHCYGIEIKENTGVTQAKKELGLENITLFLGKDSMEVCKDWNKEIDLLFIDGEHIFPNIFWDFVGWYPYVKQGNKILFHDFEDWRHGRYQIGLAARVFEGHQKYNFYSAAYNDNISSSIISITKC